MAEADKMKADILAGFGSVGTVTTGQWDEGLLNTQWVKTLTTKSRKANTKYGFAALAGDLGADVTLTGSDSKGIALKKLAVVGTLDGSRICSEGDISTITVVAIRDSDIFVGVDRTYSGRHVTDADDFLPNQGQIKSFTVKGLKLAKHADHFVDSNISAYQIGSAKLVNLESTNSSEDFGFWIMDMISLSKRVP
jgi:hypothetical protein